MSRDLHCHRIVLALPWLLNGSLESAERHEVREHLIACPSCRTELARTRELLAAVRATPAEATGPVPQVASITRPASRREAAIGRRGAHRFLWAATIASLLFSAGNVWLAVRRVDRAALADARRHQPAAGAPVVHEAVAREAVADASLPTPIVEPPPATSPASAAKRPPRIRPHAAPSAADASPVLPPVITIAETGFEGGSLASLGPATPSPAESAPAAPSSEISSRGFESGDLGGWAPALQSTSH